ncbi:hypothetical protein [Donghicola tyrosinivorans]|uniref:hypothetical protein n=1 Tax=Donghicola tyrosinivorans TaxID=1652492 RepID=UPI0011B218FD|nr:hypothetical protein [Donghicola tyrosinivorans]
MEELIYSTIPNERLGVMKSILDHCLHDACLRRILTDPLLLNEEPTEYSYRKNIAKAASTYTRKFFGVSIKTYIHQAQFQTLNEEFPVAFKHRGTRPLGDQNGQYVEQDAREFLERLREDRAKKLKDGTIKPLAA